MLSKNTLFEFLYQNLHDQITCGHLKPGDTLPSMPQLAAIYNVGIRTVKDVLARLKTEGLIQTTERKPARVIYRAEKNSASQSYAVGLLRRQESLTEVYQTMGLILPSIFHFSAISKSCPPIRSCSKKITVRILQRSMPLFQLC
jgi:DNA-binding transcriptional regulator YhcF (GntR family)